MKDYLMKGASINQFVRNNKNLVCVYWFQRVCHYGE